LVIVEVVFSTRTQEEEILELLLASSTYRWNFTYGF
jgi:hypothetical protein